MKTNKHFSFYLTSTLIGLVLMAFVTLLERQASSAAFHIGYAGAVWMFLPLPFGLALIGLAAKHFTRKQPLQSARITAYLKPAFIGGALAQLPLALYTLIFSPASLPRVLLGALVFTLSIAILALLAALLRQTTPRWLTWVLMLVFTFLGLVRGLVYLITGNMGGLISQIGTAFVTLSPPLARVAWLAKDVASGLSITPLRVILSLAYLLVLAILLLATSFKGSWAKRLLATAAALALLVISTNLSTHTVDPITMQAFNEAMQLTDNNALWPGFNMREIAFAVRDGKGELYFQDGTTPEYGPETIDVLAYTATLEDGKATLHVLGFEETRALHDPFGNGIPQENLAQYISVLTHEAFHGYQFLQIGDPMTNDGLGDMLAYETLGAALNADPAYNDLWNEELKAAYDYLEGNIMLEGYLAARAEREVFETARLSEEDFDAYSRSQRLMERLEGTARYIELMSLPGDHRQDRLYQNLSIGATGSERYYTSGMGRCLILDQIDPAWKETFTFTEDLHVEQLAK